MKYVRFLFLVAFGSLLIDLASIYLLDQQPQIAFTLGLFSAGVLLFFRAYDDKEISP